MKLVAIHGEDLDCPNACAAWRVEDEQEREIGSCAVIAYEARALFRDCPFSVLIRLKGNMKAMDMMLGAAKSTCEMLRRSYPKMKAHVYTECSPDNRHLQEMLRQHGFRMDDCEEAMLCRMPTDPMMIDLPDGLSYIEDRLESDADAAETLERINRTFGHTYTKSWLDELRADDGFRRFAAIDMSGTVGEILLLNDKDLRMGQILMLVVDRDWRGRGVGRFLAECAREYFLSEGLIYARADVWKRLEDAHTFFGMQGYRDQQEVWLYPYYEITPVEY